MKDYNAIIHNMREEHHVNFEQLRNIIYRLENKILALEAKINNGVTSTPLTTETVYCRRCDSSDHLTYDCTYTEQEQTDTQQYLAKYCASCDD